MVGLFLITMAVVFATKGMWAAFWAVTFLLAVVVLYASLTDD